MKKLRIIRNRWTSVVALLLTYVVVAVAAAPAKSSKKTPAKSSATAKKRPSAAKGKSTTTARRRTPAPPPRQGTPTPDRYREIQQALIDKGYSSAPADGAWGPGWVDALRRFQGDQNLEVDGKLGALSLIAMGLGPKRQALRLPPPPPPGSAQQQQTDSSSALAKPEGVAVP